MKVVGFTFIRNAAKFDYPIVEAISSILPLCDEVVVAVGNSEDNTRELVAAIHPDKIRIIDTVWDDSKREGGQVLAIETDKAFDAIPPDADWCFYIQGDEVIHENDLPAIKQAMETWKDDSRVEGLLFNYRHFYGSYDYVGDSRRWYRKEVRLIRRDAAIRSFRDAQGFQKNGRPLRVKQINAFVNHYGWVKPPKLQQAKQEYFHKLWHSDEWMEKNIPKQEEFDYGNINYLVRYSGSHPQVMQKRIADTNWSFSFDPTKKNMGLKARFHYNFEKLTGWRIGEYRNYRLV